LVVNGNATLDHINVAGDMTVGGDVLAAGSITAPRADALSGALIVASHTNFDASVSVANTLDVNGSVSVNGTLTSSSTATFSSSLAVDSVTVNGPLTCGDTLTANTEYQTMIARGLVNNVASFPLAIFGANGANLNVSDYVSWSDPDFPAFSTDSINFATTGVYRIQVSDLHFQWRTGSGGTPVGELQLRIYKVSNPSNPNNVIILRQRGVYTTARNADGEYNVNATIFVDSTRLGLWRLQAYNESSEEGIVDIVNEGGVGVTIEKKREIV
jgi:cytoskeletal protein CcmA (bactofilin family)